LGLTRREIDLKFKDIEGFAEIGEAPHAGRKADSMTAIAGEPSRAIREALTGRSRDASIPRWRR